MKKLVLLIMTLTLLLAGCGRNKAGKMETERETVPTTAAAETVEATEVHETTEDTTSVLEENILDGEENLMETQSPEETKGPDETKPQATVPSGSAGGNGNNGESGGLLNPEPPEQPEQPQQPQQPQQPEATTPPATEAPVPENPGQGTGNNSGTTTMTDYERYHAMSPADQQAFMESFESIEAFFVWYENAKAAHDIAKPPIDVGNGNVDLDDVIGGNG